MAKRKAPGLIKRGGVYHMDKVVKGHRIRGSTGTADLAEAETILARHITDIRERVIHGQRKQMTFAQAVKKFLKEDCPPKSLSRAITCFDHILPFIGHLKLEQVHNDTLAIYKKARLDKGTSPGTVNKELAFVRRVLNLAARLWRDEITGLSYLAQAPLIKLLKHDDPREPYPLSWEEQDRLFKALPKHLRQMCEFGVHTGLRQEELCGLKWEWEQDVVGLEGSVFVLPKKVTKNGKARVIVLNSTARKVIEERRGLDKQYVFTWRGKRISRINNPSWRAARESVGLKHVRVHDLRHTFGTRLRAAEVDFEARQDLLGHTNGNVTTHYSAPDLRRLQQFAERVAIRPEQSGVLRLVPTNLPHVASDTVGIDVQTPLAEQS